MANYQILDSPVSWKVGKHLSEVVKDFTKAKNLHCNLWYHDSPLFYVEREDCEPECPKHGKLIHFHTVVQISPFSEGFEAFFCFIPHHRAAGDSVRIDLEKLGLLIDQDKTDQFRELVEMALEISWYREEAAVREEKLLSLLSRVKAL